MEHGPMGDFVVRNLPSGVIAALKVRARAKKRSFEAEVRSILADAVSSDRRPFVDYCRRMRAEIDGGWDRDSTAMIRQERDRR
jgi:plasmid stability protein